MGGGIFSEFSVVLLSQLILNLVTLDKNKYLKNYFYKSSINIHFVKYVSNSYCQHQEKIKIDNFQIQSKYNIFLILLTKNIVLSTKKHHLHCVPKKMSPPHWNRLKGGDIFLGHPVHLPGVSCQNISL